MTIATKFSLGDTVWVIAHNKPCEGTIVGVATGTNHTGTEVRYVMEVPNIQGQVAAPESHTHGSKQELVASL